MWTNGHHIGGLSRSGWALACQSVIEKVQENANFKVWGFCDTSPGQGQCVCVFGSEGGHGNPLQYSCLENPMNGGDWCRLLSMGSQRVGHNWATSLSLSPLMALFSLPFKLENSTFSFCNGSYKLCSPVWTWPWRAMRSMRNRGKILKGSWQDHICALETCPGNRVVHGFGGPMHWRQGTQLE